MCADCVQYESDKYRVMQVSALVSLGQAQAEEGQAEDAVETFLEVLGLQENEEPDEVAEAHFQVCNTRKDRLYSVLGDLTFGLLLLRSAVVEVC